MVVLMPLTGSHVIHPRWSEHHRPTATATMTSTCVITRQDGDGTTGPDGTWTPADSSTIYTGPCRVVWPPQRDRILLVGETQETHAHALVAIRYDAPTILVGDLVEITEAEDSQLVGLQLRVQEIAYDSEQWQRNLLCDERES